MSNDVTTRMTVTGDPDRVQAFRTAHVKTEKDRQGRDRTYLDLNTFVQQPPELDIPSASTTDDGMKYWAMVILQMHASSIAAMMTPDLKEHYEPNHALERYAPGSPLRQKAIANGKQAIMNLLTHGYKDWYDWRVAHWGTKWNSYDGVEDATRLDQGKYELVFDTAWSAPLPIFAHIAEQWPDLTVELAWFDEGYGFAGTGSCDQGVFRDEESEYLVTPEMYFRVYGQDMPTDDEDEPGDSSLE